MIILTGGGGMIGSMIAWHLNTQMNFDDFNIWNKNNVNQQQTLKLILIQKLIIEHDYVKFHLKVNKDKLH